MNKFCITGLILTIALFLTSTGCADVITGENNTVTEEWIGTWTDANHSLSLEKNGSVFIGIGTPFNPDMDYPFRFAGTLSDDGTLLQTVMNDTGTYEFNISDDKMSFSGTGILDSVDESVKPFKYSINAKRNGTVINPDNIWSGEWLTVENTLFTFYQNGSSITGTAYPILDPEYIEEFNGTVSDNGQTIIINWSLSQNVNFTRSDDGLYLIETDCGENEIAKGQICFNLTKQV